MRSGSVLSTVSRRLFDVDEGREGGIDWRDRSHKARSLFDFATENDQVHLQLVVGLLEGPCQITSPTSRRGTSEALMRSLNLPKHARLKYRNK